MLFMNQQRMTSGDAVNTLPPNQGVTRYLLTGLSAYGKVFLSLVLIFAALIFFSPSAQAASIPADGTTCTLVDAITAANTDAVAGGCLAGSGADTITITNTVTLTTANNNDNGLPVISSEITIEGNGHSIARDTTSVNYFRIFAIDSTGNLTLNDISITGGLVGGNGGGFHISAGGVLQVNNSTISGNGAMISGGIENGGTITMTNSTMSGNYTTAYGAGAIGNGGTVALFNTTVTGNSAGNLGGGFDNSGTIILNRSIVAGNYAGTGADIFNRNIVIADNYNLLGSGFSVPVTSTDIGQSVGIANILNPVLGYNGGPARTHALVAGSLAIDAATDSGLATDQRGIGRPLGTADDIGAYESPSLSTLVVFTGTLSPGFGPDTIAYTMVVTNAVSSTSLTSTVNAIYATSVVTVTPPGGDPIACTGNPVECPLAVGDNELQIFVKSLDGTNAKIYTITITRLSNDATLRDLIVSVGALTPVFTPTLTTYTVTVEGVTSTLLEATPNEKHATAVVTATLPGGSSVACTGDPVECPLELGENVIEITVTAQDGTIEIYTIVVTRNPSSDNTLGDLTLGGNDFDPEFDPGITAYTATVSNLITSTIISPTVNEPNATTVVTVTPPGGGAPIACTGDPLDCPLTAGANVIEVVVTAQNGTTQTYTLTVIREPSTDASLGELGIGVGTLTPAFDPGTSSYTATVGNETASLTLTVATNEPNATITTTVTPPGGSPIVCTGDPLDCPLAVGDNVIEVTVTAQDGTTIETYTIIVTRALPSEDATLSNLAISPGTLSPSFMTSTLSYTATVSNLVTGTVVLPTLNNLYATVVAVVVTPAGGSPTACAASPWLCPLAVGNNLIEVVVTAQDGTTSKIYTLTITREPSTDATLDGLEIGVSTLAPAFDPNVTSYTATVGNTTATITLTVDANEGNATTVVTVTPPGGGTPITCTGDPLDCPLAVGDNVIEITITAQDGTTTKTYTTTVTRSPSSDATLSTFSIDAGVLSPGFSSEVTDYIATVSNVVNSLGVTLTVNEGNALPVITVTPPGGGAPIACTDNPLICPLAIGDNLIEITVTAQDGTTKIYRATITRPSDDATLIELAIDGVTLSPLFNSQVTSYVATVGNATGSINVTMAANEGNATTAVTVTPPGGTSMACASNPAVCPLAVGDNVVTVTVTAQDGSTRTYTTIVTRQASSNATLGALTISSGTLSPAFTPTNTTYVANVASGVTAFSLTPTTGDGTASVTVNGVSVASGTASPELMLPTGSHLTVTVIVTAGDGTTRTYPVVVNRAPAVVNSATSTLQGNSVTILLTTEVTDPDGDAWEVQTVANGQQGMVVLNDDGSFTYTPSAAFVGIDQFAVTVVDDYGATAQLLANVVVVAKEKSGQAGDVLVQNNATGSTHQLTNYQVNDKTLFTMNLQLPAGTYSGPLSSEDIFYLLYTEILTPTTETSTPPSGFQFAGNTFTLEAFLNELKLPNLVFGEPITLTLSYDEALLENIDEATLMLYYWDEESQSWEQSGLTEISRDLTANTVTYRIAHLTQFSWFGEDAAKLFNLHFPYLQLTK